MKPRFVVIGIVLLVLIGIFTWFWLLASVPSPETTQVTLQVTQSPVSVQRAGEGPFQAATDGMELQPGDTIKTGEGGAAIIQFFGMAQSRMDEATELVVAEASQDADVPDSLRVNVQLQAGRVWSRVLRLFDLDSGFSVETAAVVATVRGTAFDVGYGDDAMTRVWVADSAVTVLPVSVSDRVAMLRQLQNVREQLMASTSTAALAEISEVALGALPAGEMAQYNAQGTPIVHRPLSAEDRENDWFQENTQADQAFIEEAAMRRRAELARLGGATPDQQLRAGITTLSEQLHLAVLGEDQKDERMEQYLVRRLARLLDLVEAGKSGLASQEFARLENDVRSQLRNDPTGAKRAHARAAIMRVARLMDGVDARSPLYPFKQRLEDLLLVLQEGDEAAMLFSRLVAVDARIDEAARLIDETDWDDARVALDAARGGISNVSRDAEPVLGALTPERQNALIGKVLALIAREAAERARLERVRAEAEASARPAIAPSDASATSTIPVVPATTTPTPTSSAPTAPVITVPTPEFTSIRLAVGVGTLSVGTPAPMGVIADRSDGSNTDVAAKTTFRILSGKGTLNGLQFTPTVAGTSVIEASYNDNGTIHTTQTAVNATGAAVLQLVTITPSSATVKSSQRVTLTATALYADGSTKDVTGTVGWTVSPTANGSMVGNTFIGTNTSTTGASVAVTVEAAYTENGVTRVGTSSMTVN